jgi:hypothetical protein
MYPGFPEPVGTPPPATPKVRPSQGWFALPFLVALVGGGFAAYTFVTGTADRQDQVESMTRGALPATLSVPLTPGEHAVYHEYDGAHTDTFRQRPDPVVVVTGPAGPVTLEAYGPLETYGTGTYEGEAILRFQVETAGTYQVEAQASPGGASPASVAVGEPVAMPESSAIAIGIATAVATAVVWLVVAVARLVGRRNARRSLAAEGSVGAAGGTAPAATVGPGEWGWGPPPPQAAPGPGAGPGPGWSAPGTAGNWSETGGAFRDR